MVLVDDASRTEPKMLQPSSSRRLAPKSTRCLGARNKILKYYTFMKTLVAQNKQNAGQSTLPNTFVAAVVAGTHRIFTFWFIKGETEATEEHIAKIITGNLCNHKLRLHSPVSLKSTCTSLANSESALLPSEFVIFVQ